MQIGLSLTSNYPIDRDAKAILDDLEEEVKMMAGLGFDSLSFGDHHLTDRNYIQVLPTMARMSAYSGDMQLLPLFLLPFYHPVLLAEQIATLDILSGGRTTVICGLGYQPEVHAAFQVPQRTRVSRFVETFEIMRLLWTQDNVTYQGKHFQLDAGVTINPKPINRNLPMWIAGSADPAIQRSAQMADAWVVAPGFTPSLLKEKMPVYRQALTESGRSGQAPQVVLRRDAHLAPTSDAAHREAQSLFERGYRGFGQRELEESLIVGGPGECIEYLEKMQELGVTHALFRCALDEREMAMQTIKVLGEEVIPHFK